MANRPEFTEFSLHQASFEHGNDSAVCRDDILNCRSFHFGDIDYAGHGINELLRAQKPRIGRRLLLLTTVLLLVTTLMTSHQSLSQAKTSSLPNFERPISYHYPISPSRQPNPIQYP